MKLAVLGTLVLLCWPGPAHAENTNDCEIKNGEITVSKPSARIAVVLSNPPTTRAQLSFDADGRHHELEWDLAVDSRLEQHINLEATRDKPVTWHVTATVEPMTLRQGSTVALVTTTGFTSPALAGSKVIDDKLDRELIRLATEGTAAQKAWVQRVRLVDTAMDPAAASVAERQLQAKYVATTNDPAVKANPLEDWPRPTFTLSCRGLPRMDEVPFATQSLAMQSARGIGTIPTPVTETLSILSEIALDRATSGALALVKERFVTPLCGDADQDDPSRGVRLATLGLTGGGLALPRTCVLLQQLRLEDILSSGKPLLRALRDDLRLTLAPGGISRLARGTAWGTFASAALDIVNRAVDRGSFSALDAQAAFDLFKNVMPIISTIPLFDVQSRKRLEIAIAERLDVNAIKKYCNGLTDPQHCANALVAATPLGALRDALKQLGIEAERTDVAATLKAFGSVETLVELIQKQLTNLSIPLARLPGCRDLKAGEIDRCAIALARGLATGFDIAAIADDLRFESAARTPLLAFFTKQLTSLLGNDPIAAHAAAIACEVKLAVAILRTCSGQTCSANDISEMYEHPEQHFEWQDATANPDALCWKPDHSYRRSIEDRETYRAFVVDGLELLAAKAPPAARAVTVLRMFARLTQQAAGCSSGDAPVVRCRQLDAVTELLIAIAEDDHTKALASATALVRQLVPRIPADLTKGAQLIGSVVAYAEVYERTQRQDPKEAREARKKALEGLIDAATDRTGRGGAWVLSLGSNVGFSATRTSPRAGIADSWAPQLRVPLGIALDELPMDSRSGWRAGFHAGVTLGDLGQFAAIGKDGKLDDVRWDDFLGPGAELGLILGSPSRALNLSFHVEYAPALFASDGKSGALRVGLSLGYYVPFFDLN